MKTEAKAIIIAYLKKNNVKKIQVGGSFPSLTQASRRSCDYDKLKELNPTLYKQVISEGSYEKFNLK